MSVKEADKNYAKWGKSGPGFKLDQGWFKCELNNQQLIRVPRSEDHDIQQDDYRVPILVGGVCIV